MFSLALKTIGTLIAATLILWLNYYLTIFHKDASERQKLSVDFYIGAVVIIAYTIIGIVYIWKH
jgi:hypothetical protein